MMTIILVTALCLSLTTVSPTTTQAAKVNITVTIAIGGVACGIYYFVSLTLSDTLALQPVPTETGALLDHGPKGWKLGYPLLKLLEDERFGYAPYVDILSFRF
ncbi:MAG: hypothetical protein KAI84_12905 [Gammaproteobacteria bacterium]|nr:hypothetical protein [Gammaproteobacteria bacterium]